MATTSRRRTRKLAANTLTTQSPYSYTISERSTSSHFEPQLCPSHWRLHPRDSLRSKLKSLLLKEVHLAKTESEPAEPRTPRPTIMRMKDSGDYITARAANPHTGLISPSIGSPSPGTPCTPDTPGEALKIGRHETPSPTPSAAARPTLSRADEGRKISAGSLQRLRAGADGWMSDTMLASPRSTHAHAGVGLLVRGTEHASKNDHFTVHMPSAREPQPFQYPGCTPEQIKAFEHYREKTSVLKGVGSGVQERRRGPRAVSGGIHGKLSTSVKEPHRRWPTHLQRALDMHTILPRDGLKVGKRTGGKKCSPNDSGLDDDNTAEACPTAATFAPFCSPHTPAARAADTEATLLQPRRQLAQSRPRSSTPISRKPVAAPTAFATFADAGSESSPDLSRLPRVRLVQPESASLPDAHAHTIKPRQCSLGCLKTDDTGECVERKRGSKDFTHQSSAGLFGDVKMQSRDDNAEAVSCAMAGITTFFNNLRIPETATILLLLSPDAPAREKQAALRALLPAVMQLFTLLMAVTMLWRLGAALVQLLEVLFWPFAVPVKILRWLIRSA